MINDADQFDNVFFGIGRHEARASNGVLPHSFWCSPNYLLSTGFSGSRVLTQETAKIQKKIAKEKTYSSRMFGE